MTKTNETILEAKCYCGSVHFTVNIPTALLPLPAHICHCSLCRWYTGTLAVFHARLPTGIAPIMVPPSSRTNMTAYVYGPLALVEVLFCHTCGCHVLAHSLASTPGPETWTVSTSIFDLDGELTTAGADLTKLSDIFRITQHIYPASAKDGGLADMIRTIGGRELDRWDPSRDDPRAAVAECRLAYGPDGEERLLVQCHCGGVEFTLGRPSETVPVKEAARRTCVASGDGTKWRAHLDVCRYCRLQTGAHVQPWVQIPESALSQPVTRIVASSTLRTFSSSSRVERSFCSGCGATVFFRKLSAAAARGRGSVETDEDAVVSLAVGVLRAPEGPLAENWLEWQRDVAFADSGREFDPDFFEGLVEGLKVWRIDDN